ncbi:hypothetical protein [Burkholderia sp. L27(2015)]|jgi:hypothetical protein|uniref:hypothetical protein n=1 Tax=Burkholderia sp. L27(2015) TaxID=1641858 RepID=UPI00131BC2A9|nr:hypothetical protein [Burkholderia sp. L27(2015)]
MNKHLIAAVIIAASAVAAASATPAFASSRYDSASRYTPVAAVSASQHGQSTEAARTENTNAGTQSVSSVAQTPSYVLASNDNDALYSHH